jgi:hypothetical protein
MISIETDSHGRTYQIWKQNQMNSCGVASVWMARGIARRMSFAEDEWDLAQRMYRSAVGNALAPLGVPSGSAPMTLNPGAFRRDQSSMASSVARFGFFAAQVATALRAERLRVEHLALRADGNARTIQPNKIAIDRPAIVLVYWNGGGGHFVVVGRCTSSSVSFLDPWDGRVNEQPNNGVYNPNYSNIGLIGEVIYISA